MNLQMALVTKILEEGDLRHPRLYNLLPQYFTDEDARLVMDMIQDYWNTTQIVPSKETVEQLYPVDFVHSEENIEILCMHVAEELGQADFQSTLVNVADLPSGLGATDSAREAAAMFSDLSVKYGKVDLYTVGSRPDVEFDMLTTEDPTDIRIPWVWGPLQEASNGLEQGEVAILYARLKNGKTFALMEQAVFLATLGIRVLIITPEMTAKQLLRRIYAIAGAWDYQLFKTRRLFEADDAGAAKHKFKLTQLIEFFRKEKSLIIFDPKDEENQDISLPMIESLVSQHDAQALLVDQMKYLKTEKTYKEVRDKLGAVSRRFKKISRQGVPVIATHQSNRSGGKKTRDKDADDLAESDQIAQIADLAIRLRLDMDRGIRWFDVAAARELRIDGWACKSDFCTDMGVLPEDHPSLLAGKRVRGADHDKKRRKTQKGSPLIRR